MFRFTLHKEFAHSILGITLLAMLGCNEKLRHGIGKDTRDYFGDARFQVLKSWRFDTDPPSSELLLFDLEKQQTIADRVVNWRKGDGNAYFVTSDGTYVVLKITSGEVEKFPSLASIPQPHRQACERLDNH